MAIDGKDIEKLRTRLGISQAELAGMLNNALDRNYKSGSVSTWETGRRNIPDPVATFLEQAILQANLSDDTTPPAPPPPPPDADVVVPPIGPDGRQADTPPGPGPSPAGLPVPAGGVYAKACEELWEMIASGIGMVGVATRNDALVDDGKTIAYDKEKLGAAWGKLAETNETFKKMLLSMTEGGAWLQVAVVTGTTFSRCYQNHAAHAERAAAVAAQTPPPDDDEHLRVVA